MQWTLGYLAVAWLSYQLLEAVGEPWGLGDEIQRRAQILILLGLAVVPIVAAFHGARGKQPVRPLEVLLLASVALLGAWGLTRLDPVTPETPTRNRIAVLPPSNLGGVADQDAFLAFLHEQIISLLGRSLGADGSVIGRQSTLRYAGTTLTTNEIAEQLSADALVELSAMSTADSLIMTARLVGLQGEQLWTNTFRRSHSQGLGVSDVTEAVANGVYRQLVGRTGVVSASTSSIVAERLYARGRAFLNRGLDLEGDLYRAIDYFQRAVSEDPGYAAAHAGIATAFARLGGFNIISPDSAWTNAEAATRRAVRYAPDAEEVLRAAAWTSVYQLDWRAADSLFRQAVRVNPSFVDGLADYSQFLSHLDQGDRATLFADSAIALDPTNPMAQMMRAWAIGQAGDYTRAISIAEELSGETPGFGLADWWSSQMYRAQGQFALAVIELREAMATFSEDDLGDEYAFLAYLHGELGQMQEWRSAVDRLRGLETRHDRYISPVAESLAYVGIGDYERALELLEVGFRTRAGWLWLVPLATYPWQVRMGHLPEFQDLVRRIQGDFPRGG